MNISLLALRGYRRGGFQPIERSPVFEELFPRKRMQLCHALAAIAFALVSCCIHAQETTARELLSRLFSDHMVMQRGMQIPVWGWAEPGETVTVSIDRQTRITKANHDGNWMVRLDAMQTGAPRKMIVKSKTDTVEVNDILLGEVWIASGQSNMAWLLKHALNGQQEVAEASYPQIRLFNVPTAIGPRGPAERLPPGNRLVKNMNVWLPCAPETAGEFSAVAYFFGRDLHQFLQVPVGIISNAVGASYIEAWISREAYMADADFRVVAEFYDGITNYVENTPAGRKDLADMSSRYDAIQRERRARGERPLWPTKYPGPVENLGRASTLYNALVNPLVPYAMRGVIWYQGEAQSQRMYEYRGIFPLLIKDWRSQWGQGDFPFLYVQLANWGRPSPQPEDGGWGLIRESQLLALNVPNTAMAVTIDVGDAADIHPKNKQDVGKRLALAARARVYGENIVYSGPVYRQLKVEGNAIRMSFNHVGSGLMAGRKSGLEPVVEDQSGKLKHFAIAGEDMKFVWADAVIDGSTVMVSSSWVTKPVAVRYGWAQNPDGANLYNKEGLPASPFRTDENKPVPIGSYFRSQMEKGISLQRWRPIREPPARPGNAPRARVEAGVR